MDPEAYYERVRSAYDRIAPRYDDSVGRHAVSRRAKRLALEVIKEVTPPGGRLLDVGCYTGIEALLLAQQGYRVLGIDLSPEMVRNAQLKAKKWRIEDRARFQAMRASDVSRLQGDPLAPFDTAYSVYGTLNLEPEIGRFKEGLLPILRSHARFVCGLLNPTVFYELIFAPLVGKFHGYRKLPKRAVKTSIGLGEDTVETFLYSADEFEAIMAPEFNLERVVGLHILYPPPRGGGGRGLWWVARVLDAAEFRLESRYPFRNLGFFTLFVFQKRSR